MVSRPPLIVLDGDDTLWVVEMLFDEARCRAAAVVAAAELSAARWEHLEREIDVANVARMGLSSDRFPTSCVEAYERLAAESGIACSAAVASAIRTAASFARDARAPLVEGAEDVLRCLNGYGEVVLLTKGDAHIQQRRVEESGLKRFFKAVYVVPIKTAAEFRMVLRARSHVDGAASWSVGNSLASDINPAVACGMRAIWIDAHVWEYERRETVPVSDGVFIAHDLGDVPSIVAHRQGRRAGLATR